MRWQLVVGLMAATITRARIRQTAAELEEGLPPLSFRLWDPFEVLDPRLDDRERSPFFFFFFLFLLFPRLSSLADGAAGLGGCWNAHSLPRWHCPAFQNLQTWFLDPGDIDLLGVLDVDLGLPFLPPLPFSVFSCLYLQSFPLVHFPARKS